MTLLGLLAGLLLTPPALAAGLDSQACLACHDGKSHKLEVPGADGKPHTLAGIAPDTFGAGVHGKMACTACHAGITDNPAEGAHHNLPTPAAGKSVGCADCHTRLWDDAQKNGSAAAKPRLGVVVENIAAYKDSFHARAKKGDKTQVNATCDNCHSTHTFNVPPKASPEHKAWRATTPGMCGDKCHSDELEEYSGSVHGKAALDKANPKATQAAAGPPQGGLSPSGGGLAGAEARGPQVSAVCIDCHQAHGVGNTSAGPVKLAITASCGSCHAENYKSYKATYHGQISTLGYAYTAKCFDCHGSHGILKVSDPESKVHPNNRLETCKSCHNGKKDLALAPAGFATFQPHGTTDNFARYPQMWVGWQIMVQLLVGTFGFFWLHTLLWFYREWKDGQQAKTRPAIKLSALPPEAQGKQFRRFSAIWRLGHILFALSLMILTLTGMPLFYPDVAWAPLVMKALGGPKMAGTIHRINAVVFAGVFFWHLFYMGFCIWRRRATWRWFGPDSMIPNLQDGKDIIAMFKWFFDKAPRPVFDRWTYWEKFDYWAPFWGVTIIGVSGLMMWLPNITGSFLPGWVFNVAAIFHGEEAFLAVVFLFTVHFFNNHFRPGKFPLETVMFTGSMTLDHYRREHPLHYQRLLESGELAQHLVDAPSAPMRLGSKVLGFTLIAVGLTLLAGVAMGFFHHG